MPEGPLITPTRFEDAIYKLSTKAPMGAALRSDDWQRVPVALRERAFFSATVESVQYLQAMRSFLDDFLINKREKLADGTEVLKSQGRAQFVADMQEKAAALGMPPLLPGKDGTIEDPTASGRLRLIFDTVTQQAYDYGYFKQGQDPAVLNAFPAQRFIREHSVQEPRDYHEANIGVIRRKDDKEFWLSMNRDFRVPWGPWGFNSGMGVEDVDREEAESLGLVSPTEQLQPDDSDFNQELAASVSGLDADMVELLKRAFGKQVEFSGDKVKWKGQQFAQPKAQRLRKSLQAPKAPPLADGQGIPNSPDAPLSLPDTAQEDGFPPLDRLVRDKALGGTTGAELWRDPKTGARFVIKRGASPDHLRSEFAADEAYRALGVRVPAAKLLETPQGPVKMARFVEDGEQLGSWLAKAKPAEREAMLKQLQADFAVDALLGNWDVVGLNSDNILVDRTGAAWRIDNGGALAFRAQGARKTGEEWGEWAVELWTMRGKEIALPGKEAMFGKVKTPTQDAATSAFGSANFYDIARRIEAIQGEKLAKIVPQEQLAIVEARLAKMKKLATTALDHEHDQFKATFADEKLQLVFAMDKRGVFAGLQSKMTITAPGQVTLYGGDDKRAWSGLQTKGLGTATKKAAPGAPAPLKEDVFWPDIEKALKHVGAHMKGGKIGDSTFSPEKYKPALAHRPALEKLTQDKKAPLAVLQMANLYLKALGELEKAIAGQPGVLVTKYEQPLQAPKAAAQAPAPKPAHESIVAAYGKFAEAVGINTQIADDWMESLSGAATNEGAMRMKAWVFEQMEGVKESDFHWDLPLVTAKSMLRQLEQRWGGRKDTTGQAVRLSFAGWQGLVQEVFARTDLPFNDRERRVVRIIRTEKDVVVKGMKVGQLSGPGVGGRRGLAESASLTHATCVHAWEVTTQAVPYSHILGFYAMERPSRHGQTSFLNDDENEVPIIPGRLRFRYHGYRKEPDLIPESDATKWGLPLDHLRSYQQNKKP